MKSSNSVSFSFPREGGIVTLWCCGTGIGAYFLVWKLDFLSATLFVAGSALLLISTETVKEFIWRKRSHYDRQNEYLLLIPPAGGLALWSLIVSFSNLGSALSFLVFLSILSLVVLQVIKRKERESKTRAAYAGAVSVIPFIGLFVSKIELGGVAIVLIFAILFSFFTAQELFVQLLIDTNRSSIKNEGLQLSKVKQGKEKLRIALICVLLVYLMLGAISFVVIRFAIIPILFELLLVSFPVFWYLAIHRDREIQNRLNFRTIGVEQAIMDILVAGLIIAFVFFAAGK